MYIMEKVFEIGNTVKTIGMADYNDNVPIGTIGKIIRIRHRYCNTPAEYKQYKVEFEQYPTDAGNVDNFYTTYNIELLHEN